MNNTLMGKYVAVINRREQKYVNEILQPYDLGFSCYKFLLFLSGNEGCNQKKLCRDMCVDEAVATRGMRKLQAEGYVCRKKTEEDGRSYTLFLTEKGKELVPVIRNTVKEWWDQVMKDFTEEERKTLLRLLEHMWRNVMELTEEEKEGDTDGSQRK